MGCKSSNSVVENENRKSKLLQIKKLVEDKNWKTIYDNAKPLDNQTINKNTTRLNGGLRNQIPINGNEFINVTKDSIEVSLSYFGTFTIGATYSPSASKQFQFKRKIDAYNVALEKNSKHVSLQLVVLDNKEKITISFKFYSNNKVNATIDSNHRTSILYTGTLKK